MCIPYLRCFKRDSMQENFLSSFQTRLCLVVEQVLCIVIFARTFEMAFHTQNFTRINLLMSSHWHLTISGVYSTHSWVFLIYWIFRFSGSNIGDRQLRSNLAIKSVCQSGCCDSSLHGSQIFWAESPMPKRRTLQIHRTTTRKRTLHTGSYLTPTL